MPELSAEDARQLAADFHDFAVSVGQCRFDNWDSLTFEQRCRLESLQWTLLNYSSDFSSQAIAITLGDLDGTLKRIKDATDEADRAIKKIKTIDIIIGIAVAGTVLGAAITSGNPDGIASAIQGVYGAVSS